MLFLVLWLLSVVGLLVVASWGPRIAVARLTKGKVRTRHLQNHEVWQELWAELKARRIVAEVRRERAQHDERSE